jgi:DNA-binding XRE family transcriptional regulator
VVRPSKPPVLDPELIALATARGPGRQRKKPRKKTSPIGEALATLRVKCGFTQAELAEAARVSLKFIRKVEQGGLSVNLEVLMRVAEFLGAEVRLQERDE